jgi:arabinofuranosyltransferase
VRSPRFLIALLAVTVAVAIQYARVLEWAWPITIDDAFISFRYARNLAEGHGLVWNPGEAPVEGYSNFLWVILLAIPHRVGADAVTFAKVAGVVASVGSLAATFFMVRRLSDSVWAGLVAVLFLGHSVDFVINAALGLETSLYLLLLALALWGTFALASDPTRRRALLTGLAFAGLALTRPEGPVVFVVALAWLGFAWRGRPPWRAATLLVGAFAAIVVPYLAFRISYYGDIVPTAVRAKQIKDAHGFVAQYLAKYPGAAGPAYVTDAFRTYSPFVFLTAATVIAASRETLERLLLLSAVVVAYVVGIWHTWPVMGLAHRLLFPAVLALGAAAAPGVVALLRRWRSPAAIVVVAAVAFLGLRFLRAQELPGGYWNQHGPYREFLAGYGGFMRELHEPLARDLARTPGITIAMTDVGLISYRSGVKVIDLFGLADRHIARVGPDPDYVLARRPELIILMSRETSHYDGWYDWEEPFWTHPGFIANYTRQTVYRGRHYNFIVFRRNDYSWQDYLSQ